MTKINDAYINALLADATYALDDKVTNGLTGADLEDALNKRMTPTLAQYISDNFTVVTHKETSDVLASGFDATVWKDVSGKYYVSMQGSTGLADFVADIDLTVSGVAKAQIRDMVNWWLKNTTPIGEEALQVILNIDGHFEVFEPITGSIVLEPVIGTGILDGLNNVTVNGHSLGGHLATAFTRLFGEQWSVDHTYTYNSAGFTESSGIIFSELDTILGADISSGVFPGKNEQSNFFAENGINVTTQNLFNGQKGRRIPLFNEEGTGLPNHYMYKLTDALALGNMLESLDNTFTLEKMNTLFEAGSNQADSSQENILDSLRRLVLGNSITATPVGDAGDSPDSRKAYYINIEALKNTLFVNPDNLVLVPKNQYQNLQLVDVNSLANSSHLDNSDGFAYRYALANLNPFAITGNADLYSQHNSNGELNADHFSATYLQDRSLLLNAIIQRNSVDTTHPDKINGQAYVFMKNVA